MKQNNSFKGHYTKLQMPQNDPILIVAVILRAIL